MNEIISNQSSDALPVAPVPNAPVKVRPGTTSDLPFIDALQKQHGKALGFMHKATLEGKIELGHVLVADDLSGRPIGYVIGNDRYFKRDEVGIIYQLCVEPGRQRGLVAATLLKEQFERSAYGCRLYCCWCAQDLEANQFWEAMGFVPLACRAGAKGKGKNGKARVHIFWQKRIVRGDIATPWWFPSKTDGGAMRADRLAIPIPPGTHWSEARPLEIQEPEQKKLPKPRKAKMQQVLAPVRLEEPVNGLCFAIPKPDTSTAIVVAEPLEESSGTRETPKPAKINFRYVQAARELRDRYLEQINHPENAGLIEGRERHATAKALPPAASLERSALQLAA